MGDRYECTLSAELLKKAVEELREPEDNSVRLSAIDKLRTRFQEEVKDMELIRSDDVFLLRFLRVRKFDQDAAFKMLVNYHKQRKDWREIFTLVENPKLCERLIRKGVFLHLKNRRARDGTFVVIGRPGHGFKEKKDMLRFIAVVILTLEKLLEQEEFQIFGLTVIQDMTSFGIGTVMQMLPHGRKLMFVVQEAMPIRVKSLNMVNEAFVFDAIYAIMSKFMKEKMKKRLSLHGGNFTTLHEKVDPANLPPYLGGTGPDLDPMSSVDELLHLEEDCTNAGVEV